MFMVSKVVESALGLLMELQVGLGCKVRNAFGLFKSESNTNSKSAWGLIRELDMEC